MIAQLETPPAARTVPTKSVTALMVNDWMLHVGRLELMLAMASDHLGEDIPYTDATRAGVDRLDALIDGIAAMTRRLAKELADADAPV